MNGELCLCGAPAPCNPLECVCAPRPSNYIQRLRATVETRELQNEQLREAMQDFSAYLASPKFTSKAGDDYIRTWEVISLFDRLRSIMTAADDVSLVRVDVRKEAA